MEKEEFRNRIRLLKARSFGGNQNDYARFSEEIAENLLSFPNFLNFEVVGLFASKDTSFEPITDDIISKVLKNGQDLYLPRCITGTNDLEFLKISNLIADTEIANFSIREPKKTLPMENQQLIRKKMELLVVPGLAFDIYGNRLGYGSGYYDNFISKYRRENSDSLVAALCFNFQLFQQKIPHSETDMKVDYMITQNAIIKSQKTN